MRKTVFWLGQASILSIIFFTVYFAVQQVYRQGANDPQIKMAADLAEQYRQGGDVGLDQLPKVDPSKSLSAFAIAYDGRGQVLASNMELNGKTPPLPEEVRRFVRQYGEKRFTWQPAGNTRIAAVVRYFDGGKPGFVLAGRSLREVEEREGALQSGVGLAWLASLCVLGASIYVLHSGRPRAGN